MERQHYTKWDRQAEDREGGDRFKKEMREVKDRK